MSTTVVFAITKQWQTLSWDAWTQTLLYEEKLEDLENRLAYTFRKTIWILVSHSVALLTFSISLYGSKLEAISNLGSYLSLLVVVSTLQHLLHYPTLLLVYETFFKEREKRLFRRLKRCILCKEKQISTKKKYESTGETELKALDDNLSQELAKLSSDLSEAEEGKKQAVHPFKQLFKLARQYERHHGQLAQINEEDEDHDDEYGLELGYLENESAESSEQSMDGRVAVVLSRKSKPIALG